MESIGSYLGMTRLNNYCDISYKIRCRRGQKKRRKRERRLQ